MEIDLSDIQAGVLKPHGRKNVSFVFLRVSKDSHKSLVKMLESIPVTSAKEQNKQTQAYKLDVKKDDSLLINILFAVSFYSKLSLPASYWPRDVAFRRGSRVSSITSLREKGKGKWQPEFRNEFDILISVAGNNENTIDNTVNTLIKPIAEKGNAEMWLEIGLKLTNKSGYAIEPFGFRDGISNLKYDLDACHDESSFSPLDNVLAVDPVGSYGSYLVYRKLQQNVRLFKDQCKELAKSLSCTAATAQALVAGRQKNGTPLDGSDTLNDFTFENDPEGQIWPLCSHVRKSNKRDKDDLPHRLIVRRGIPYQDKESKTEGLHFLCFQKDISSQYEFIQKFWLNNISEEDFEGSDPIAKSAHFDSKDQFWPTSNGMTQRFDFDPLVKVQGCEYMFLPSLSGIEKIRTSLRSRI